ncbi:phosphodiester glycosidase family protein [Colwellia sp. RSH04]|uniref:phosphodiester glycosidase family protein n=1 Tax=Colwellia sp. RSH04 TaxID=2305464 RepID=UPI0015F8579A|nr:phosphodiester glycosidase family protein [Colwellia sp. RSH04]
MLKKSLKLSSFLLFLPLLLNCGGGGTEEKKTTTDAYQIEWNNLSDTTSLPTGVEFYSAKIEGTGGSVHYLKLDLINDALELRAISVPQSQNLNEFVKETGAIAAINGGYFSGNTSYSAVIDNFNYFARNVTSLNRNSKAYPVLRSGLTVSADNTAEVNWIYQFDQSGEVYKFEAPLAYATDDSTPLPVPEKDDGTAFMPKLVIGGGPTLVKDGLENLSYAEEVFWGSGVFLNDLRPRTAVCVTADQHLIMLVATHYKISALPKFLISIGCENAMNLDGGGSSAMATFDTEIYNQNRAVPSALVIVDKNTYAQ